MQEEQVPVFKVPVGKKRNRICNFFKVKEDPYPNLTQNS
jgi:hypothetical protein